jgi:hypothetical protein
LPHDTLRIENVDKIGLEKRNMVGVIHWDFFAILFLTKLDYKKEIWQG